MRDDVLRRGRPGAGAVPAISTGPAASAGTVHVLSAADVPGNVPHLTGCAVRVQLSGFPAGEHQGWSP